MTMGWTCPACGRCYAPWMSECRVCGNVQTELSSTTWKVTGPGKCDWWTTCSKCGASHRVADGHACPLED